MKRINIDREWNFRQNAPSVMSVMAPGGETVNFPHDAAISQDVNPKSVNGGSTGWYDGCYANYNKYYTFPKEWQGKKVYLYLDGSFWCTEISVNGNLVAMHPSGYAPYCADITDCIDYGENNRINLFVNNAQQRTGRWYSGTGVYRHVFLLVGDKVHLAANHTFVSTEKIEGKTAQITACVKVQNESDTDREITVCVELAEDNGRENPAGKICVQSSVKQMICAGQSVEIKLPVTVENAKLWDIDTPNLYRVKTTLSSESDLLDTDESICGIRTVEVSRKNGLLLNGKQLKLKGGSVHSGNGILGAVSLYDAEYRKVKLHKNVGYNAFRCAHNPPSEVFLEVCDRLGMLVLDELFDVWNMLKDPNDYHLFFADWWKRDAEYTVLRDRVHPCVFAYSIGNEIGERQGLGNGYALSAEIAGYVKSLDGTRYTNLSLPTTFNGLNDKDTALMFQSLYKKLQGGEKIQNLTTEYSDKVFNEKTASFAQSVDFVGYNYLEDRLESDIAELPERIFVPTESHPSRLGFIWDLVEKHNCILGDFVWTSMDYLGEVGLGVAVYSEPGEKNNYSRLNPPPVNYPFRTANLGDFDITGEQRNQLQYRQCVWGSDKTYLEILHPDKYGKDVYISQYGWDDAYLSWNFTGYEGRKTTAKVYSRAEEVELIVNGKSCGRKPCGKANDYTAQYEVVYERGEITAVSFAGGKEVSRISYKSVGQPCKLIAKADKCELNADGESLVFITAYIADKDGNPVPHIEMKCKAVAEGVITLAALGSGNPVTDENYTKGEFTTYHGKILAIVRSGYAKGNGTLTLKCGDFDEVKMVFKVN